MEQKNLVLPTDRALRRDLKKIRFEQNKSIPPTTSDYVYSMSLSTSVDNTSGGNTSIIPYGAIKMDYLQLWLMQLWLKESISHRCMQLWLKESFSHRCIQLWLKEM
eukprot:sb/3477819/